ncbi:MAG TPA: hypothetical protein VD788_10975 [Candidatus Polarisedimenticolaceae bacterium]|nr:hypothetical protein [Candidatus Polarisedimenticolaceae bacterium]
MTDRDPGGARDVIDFRIDVECYAGHRGEETPRRFAVGRATIEVADVVDRWLAPEHRYFKVRGDDGGLYILRHDPVAGSWSLTMFESAALRDA